MLPMAALVAVLGRNMLGGRKMGCLMMVLLSDMFLPSMFLPICGVALRRRRGTTSRVSYGILLPRSTFGC